MRTNLKVEPTQLNSYRIKITLPNGQDRSPKRPMLFSHPCDAVLYAFDLHGFCKVRVMPE